MDFNLTSSSVYVCVCVCIVSSFCSFIFLLPAVTFSKFHCLSVPQFLQV